MVIWPSTLQCSSPPLQQASESLSQDVELARLLSAMQRKSFLLYRRYTCKSNCNDENSLASTSTSVLVGCPQSTCSWLIDSLLDMTIHVTGLLQSGHGNDPLYEQYSSRLSGSNWRRLIPSREKSFPVPKTRTRTDVPMSFIEHLTIYRLLHLSDANLSQLICC